MSNLPYILPKATDKEVKVKDYGAVGNGSTDDTAAINSALTDAVGGVCFFESGLNYNIDSDVTLPSNTRITTTGAERATISGTGDFIFAGTLSATTSNMTTSLDYGDYTFDVVSGASFAADDVIEIKSSSSDPAEESQRRELATIASVVTNTITLKEPCKNQYKLGYSGFAPLTGGTTTIAGLSNIYVSEGSASGNGTLAYLATPNTLSWAENGDTAGTAVDVSAGDGLYRLYSNNGEFITLLVDFSVLDAGGDATDTGVAIGTTGDFVHTFASPPLITKVTTVKENLYMNNIELDGVRIHMRHAKNIEFKQFKQSNNVFAYFTNYEGPLHNLNVQVEVEQPIGSGANSCARIYNWHDFTLDIDVFGGANPGAGINMNGSTNGYVKRCNIRQIAKQAIYMNHNVNVHFYNPSITGTQNNDDNYELIRFDGSYNCTIHNPYVNEPNKNGGAAGVDIVEFSNLNDHCYVYGGTFHIYTCNPVIVKADSKNIGMFDTTFVWHTETSAGYQIQFQTQNACPKGAIWRFKGIKVIDKTGLASFNPNLLRCSTNTYISGYPVELFDVSDCTLQLNDAQTLVNANFTVYPKGSTQFNVCRFNDLVCTSEGVDAPDYLLWNAPTSTLIAKNNLSLGNPTNVSITTTNVENVIVDGQLMNDYSITGATREHGTWAKGTFTNDTIGTTTEDGFVKIWIDNLQAKLPFWYDN
jgi:hypothetical protein